MTVEDHTGRQFTDACDVDSDSGWRLVTIDSHTTFFHRCKNVFLTFFLILVTFFTFFNVFKKIFPNVFNTYALLIQVSTTEWQIQNIRVYLENKQKIYRQTTSSSSSDIYYIRKKYAILHIQIRKKQIQEQAKANRACRRHSG